MGGNNGQTEMTMGINFSLIIFRFEAAE